MAVATTIDVMSDSAVSAGIGTGSLVITRDPKVYVILTSVSTYSFTMWRIWKDNIYDDKVNLIKEKFTKTNLERGGK